MRPTGALMLMCKGCEGLFHVMRKFYSCRNASCGKRQRVCVSICTPLCHNLVEVALMVVQRKEKQAWKQRKKKERQLQIWMAANEIKWKRNTQTRATPASAVVCTTSHLKHIQTTITTFHRNRMHNCIKCPKFDLKMLHTFRQRSKCSWTGVTRCHTQPQNIKRTKILQI